MNAYRMHYADGKGKFKEFLLFGTSSTLRP